MNKLSIKRVYATTHKSDGVRILVDRLWPRGIKKSESKVDLWLKDIAPSNELRKWFAHDPAKWNQFKNKYKKELKYKEEELEIIRKQLKDSPVTLVYGARDKNYNQAIVLHELVQNNH